MAQAETVIDKMLSSEDEFHENFE